MLVLTDFFPLQWGEPTENYENLSGSFVRTPVRWDKKKNTIDLDATYDDPRKLFPEDYVDYIEILYGKEKDTGISFLRIL